MTWKKMVLTAVAAAALVGGCGDDEDDDGAREAPPTAYFGWLLGAATPTAVALETDAPVSDGPTKLRAYVCDGQGPPRGKAIWFAGQVDAAATRGDGTVEVTSAAGDETLELDNVTERHLKGDFTDASGKSMQFVAYPATDGAGIYQVTLDEDLRYSGVSKSGDKVTARADRAGTVEGRVTTKDGEEIPFKIRTLSLAPPADLTASGLSTEYRRDARRSLVPGEYTAVVSPGSTHWLGRSGSVRGGSPGSSIIGLDKKD